MSRWERVLSTLRWRGGGFFVYLLTGVLYPRLTWALLRRLPARLVSLPQPPEPPPDGWEDGDYLRAEAWLPAATWRVVQESAAADPDQPVVVGRIDNDGRLLPLCGPVPDFDPVSSGEFVERYRYDLEVVVWRGRVLICKSYREDRVAFLRESAALARLAGTAAPSLFYADIEQLRVYKSLLPGATLRQRLVELGARILSIDTERDPQLQGLSAEQRIETVWRRGRERLDGLPGGFVESLARNMDEIHSLGVTGFSLTFGNVVLDGQDAAPRYLDFDASAVHPETRGAVFRWARDRDRRTFQRIYGSDLVTEQGARETLHRIATPYAPVDLGRGLVTRGFWSVDSGTGRWQLLNGEVLRPLIVGQRILDLGSFNALNPLLMLADGAREVVAVEKDSAMIPKAEELQRLFEWRDMTRYELDLRCADMRAILDADWGAFDLVTAFCSLYYLEADDMARVVRRASELAPALVLQAKSDTRPDAGDEKALKSSPEFMRRLLVENGFPRVEVQAPSAFSRPLLIGRREGTPIKEASRG